MCADRSEIDALRHEVHLWRLMLDRPRALRAQETILASDERERASRFHFDRDRVRYVIGRAALRRILGRYLDARPEALRFVYGFAGKPALEAPQVEPGVEFNLSHSHEVGLLAVTRGQAVGVDVERVRPLVDLTAIATRFFCETEAREVVGREPPERERAFFSCWTRKEAFLKAFGAGLSVPLDGFQVSVDPDAPARLLDTSWRPQERARWTLTDVSLEEGVHAALALEGTPRAVRVRVFADSE